MADVKSFTVHGVVYDVKDETARTSYETLLQKLTAQESEVDNLTEQVNGHTTNISDINSNIDSVESNVSTLQSTVSGHTTLFEKYGSYETDDTAVLWAGTSNRQLSTQTGAIVTAHYSVVGRIVFFNIYASAVVLESGELAWISCSKIFSDYPALDNSMPVLLANQNMLESSDGKEPSYGIIESTFVKFYNRDNTACRWNSNIGGQPQTLRLSGFYISSNKVEPESAE